MTEIVKIPEKYNNAITTALQIKDLVSSLVIKSETDVTLLNEAAREAHTDLKQAETVRKQLGAPFLKSKKEIDSFFKPLTEALNDIITTAKRSIMSWEREKEKAKVEALSAGTFDKQKAIETSEQTDSAFDFRKYWTFEVTDLDQVPRELMVLDNKKVLVLMGANNPEELNVPGIRFYQESTPVLKRQKKS